MRKEIVFGINRNAREGKLYSGPDPDPVNGYNGELLGIYRIDNKDLMFTRILCPVSKEGKRKSVRVNEVDFDVSYDGSVEVYYSYDKGSISEQLEETLNTGVAQSLLDTGTSIYTILSEIDINPQESKVGKTIVRSLREVSSYASPEEHDYDEVMSEVYGQDNYEREATPIKVALVHATGVSQEAFASLKEVKAFCRNESHSLYENAFEVMKKRRTLKSMIIDKYTTK